jgi:hypothetical protein
MTKINLLTYLDKSFSEIHQIENFGLDDTEKQSKNFFQNLFQPKYIYTAALLLILLAFAVFAYFLFTPEETTEINTTGTQETTQSSKEKIKTNPSDEEFEKIGSITFVEDNVSSETVDMVTENEESTAIQGEPDKKTPNLHEPKKTAETQKASPREKEQTTTSKTDTQKNKPEKKKPVKAVEYIIVINDINKELTENIVQAAKQKGLKLHKTISSEKKEVWWEIYIPSESGKTRIGDVRVTLNKKFKSKEQAVNYAGKISGKVFVKKSVYSYNLYDITVESFKSISDAKQFAKTINAGGNPIKIAKKP